VSTLSLDFDAVLRRNHSASSFKLKWFGDGHLRAPISLASSAIIDAGAGAAFAAGEKYHRYRVKNL
jgi:hypothetical protein